MCYNPKDSMCVRLVILKGTQLSLPTERGCTVSAVSAKHPLTSTGRAPGCLEVLLKPTHQRWESSSPRVAIHLQGRVIRQEIPRPSLFSGPESLTENSLGLHLVTVAEPHERPNARTRGKHPVVSKSETNVN